MLSFKSCAIPHTHQTPQIKEKDDNIFHQYLDRLHMREAARLQTEEPTKPKQTFIQQCTLSIKPLIKYIRQ